MWWTRYRSCKSNCHCAKKWWFYYLEKYKKCNKNCLNNTDWRFFIIIFSFEFFCEITRIVHLSCKILNNIHWHLDPRTKKIEKLHYNSSQGNSYWYDLIYAKYTVQGNISLIRKSVWYWYSGLLRRKQCHVG